MFKVISLKNITCRLQEDKHLEFLPLHFHAFLSTQPVLALYPRLERNSLPLNYFLYAYRLSSLFLVFFFSFFLSFFFFLTLFSHNRAYRISLNLNSTQLKVSVNRLLLDVSHICFGAPCSSFQWRLSPSLSSLFIVSNRCVCTHETVDLPLDRSKFSSIVHVSWINKTICAFFKSEIFSRLSRSILCDPASFEIQPMLFPSLGKKENRKKKLEFWWR